MYGAILGDIIGSPYEFDRGGKTKDFPLFHKDCNYTDDSIMTLAVAEALMEVPADASDEEVRQKLVERMRYHGKRYPYAGWGARFGYWLVSPDPKPYGSCGNGSAMRVSAVGWLYEDLDTVLRIAALTSDVTHDHPEGIKGAQAVAAAIFLARIGSTKEQIKAYIQENFHYDLSRTCDQIRPGYRHVETCQETVPEAITAFLEGGGFEDVIRTAVSLGGDCDTLTCIAGSMAEAFYGVPEALKRKCREYLTPDLLPILERFEERRIVK